MTETSKKTTPAQSLQNPDTQSRLHAGKWLNYSARLWFVIMLVGQWIFVFYVAKYFGGSLFENGVDGMKETHLPHGYVDGDVFGNTAIAAHVMLAVIVIGLGPLQLIPRLRARFPTIHRYIGRLYIGTAYITSVAGLYLVWTRGTVGGFLGHIAISLDAILIIVFATIALRHAMARRIPAHRRWALRLFMVVSAVWFFRVGLMGWYTLTGGIGIDNETFTGPALTFIFFGQMFIPLALLELYFKAQKSTSPRAKTAMAALLFAATCYMGLGIFAATMGMWLPRL